MSPENRAYQGNGVIDRFKRTLFPQHPTTNVADNIYQIIPSDEFVGVDSIVIPKSVGIGLPMTPIPGSRLLMPTDADREALDAPALRIDEERTRFLMGAVTYLVQPYEEMFGRMAYSAKDKLDFLGRDRVKTISRQDNVVGSDIKYAIDTSVRYVYGVRGKSLEEVSLRFGNNVDNQWVPNLILRFTEGRISDVKFSFNLQKKDVARRLIGSSILKDVLSPELAYPPQTQSSEPASLILGLVPEMKVTIYTDPANDYWDVKYKRIFTWEPREKLFRNFRDGYRYTNERGTSFTDQGMPTLTQSEFIQIIRAMLALIPTIESGALSSRKPIMPRGKSLNALIKEVEKSDIPSEEQLGRLLELMREDSRQRHIQMGLPVRHIEDDVEVK